MATIGFFMFFSFYEGILISFASKSITLEIMKTNKRYLQLNERLFYLAPDDISFFNITTVPFDTEPPPTDDLLDAVSEEVSSFVSAPRNYSILHIFVCLVTVALEVILEFWKKEESTRSKIWAIRGVW